MEAKVLKGCVIGGKEYAPGQIAQVREKDAGHLIEKGFVSVLDGPLPDQVEGASSGVSTDVADLQAKLQEQSRVFDGAWQEAQQEIANLKAEREQAAIENDKLKAELDALKADAEKPGDKADDKKPGDKADDKKPSAKGKADR